MTTRYVWLLLLHAVLALSFKLIWLIPSGRDRIHPREREDALPSRSQIWLAQLQAPISSLGKTHWTRLSLLLLKILVPFYIFSSSPPPSLPQQLIPPVSGAIKALFRGLLIFFCPCEKNKQKLINPPPFKEIWGYKVLQQPKQLTSRNLPPEITRRDFITRYCKKSMFRSDRDCWPRSRTKKSQEKGVQFGRILRKE